MLPQENAENRYRQSVDTEYGKGAIRGEFCSRRCRPSGRFPSRTASDMFRNLVILTILAGCHSGCHVLTRTNTDTWPQTREYCRDLDEMYARHRATRRAVVSLRQCYRNQNCDFRSGYVQAYVDVAIGGSGALPPVPPERYWKACRRDPEGHQKATDWFAGYAAGSQNALGSTWHAYNTVPASASTAACSSTAGCTEDLAW